MADLGRMTIEELVGKVLAGEPVVLAGHAVVDVGEAGLFELAPAEIRRIERAFEELIEEAKDEERAWREQARVIFLVLVRTGLRLNGAAQESNLPSLGLPDLTGFEDRLGHRARAAPNAQ